MFVGSSDIALLYAVIDYAKLATDNVKDDPGYLSQLKDIDDQLKIYYKKIKEIDKELEEATGDERRELLREKEELWATIAEDFLHRLKKIF